MSNRRPGWGDGFNALLDFFFDPCDAPFSAYAKTFFPALGTALYEYYISSIKELVVAFARPARAQLQRRGRRKRGGRPRGVPPGIWARFRRLVGRVLAFDFFNEAGKRLPLAREIRARHVSAGVLNWWSFYDLTQRLMYWLMVADVLSNFWYNWRSGMMKTRHCQEAERGVLLVTGGPFLIGNIVNWSGVNISNIEKQRGPVDWWVSGGTGPEWGYQVVFDCSFGPVGSEGGTVEAIIFRGQLGDANIVAHETLEVGPFQRAHLALSASIARETGWGVRVRTTEVLQNVEEAVVGCYSNRRPRRNLAEGV